MENNIEDTKPDIKTEFQKFLSTFNDSLSREDISLSELYSLRDSFVLYMKHRPELLQDEDIELDAKNKIEAVDEIIRSKSKIN